MKKLIVDVWVTEGDQIVARYTEEGRGTWRVLEGSALRKARTLADKSPDRDIGSTTTMKECD